MIRVISKAAASALLALVCVMPAAHAAFGDPDCSVGSQGAVLMSNNAFGGPVGGIAEPDGNALVRFGYVTSWTGLHRVSPSGVATALRVTASTGQSVTDYEDGLQADGRIVFPTGNGLVSGNPATDQPPGIGRMLPDGTLDTTFGTNGYATLSGFTVASANPIIQGDGRIVAGGTFNGAAALVRFNPNGIVDTSYGTSGVASNPAAGPRWITLALQADGSIVAASASMLARYLPTGQLDTAFGTNGTVDLTNFILPSFVRMQGSKILVAGKNASGQARIARYNANGSLDTTAATVGYRDVAGPGGPLVTLYFVLDPLGRPIVVGAYAPTSGGGTPTSGALVRLSADLADDASLSVAYAPAFVVILPNGRLWVGYYDSNRYTNALRRYLADGEAANCVATSVVVTSTPNPSNYGQAVTITATVTPASGPTPATGTVQFFFGSNPSSGAFGAPVALSNGTASTTLGPYVYGEGNITIGATYTPDAAPWLSSTSAAYVHTITPRIATTITLTSSVNPSAAGQPVTLTAVVTAASGGPINGTVNFKDNFNTIGGQEWFPLVNGTGSITVSFTPGTHSLTAFYPGDNTYRYAQTPAMYQGVDPSATIDSPRANSAVVSAMTFTVRLSGAVGIPVSVDYATTDHSAVAGTDYTATSGTLTFNPGETTKTISVPITHRTIPVPDRDFFLSLSNPTGGLTLSTTTALGTIFFSAPGALSLYVDDPVLAEGPAGVTLMGFTVSLSAFSYGNITVNYATANDTAVAGTDFTGVSGTLTFYPGQTKRWVMVPILGNTTPQADRTFFLNLTSGSVAIAKAQGVGTIKDDDPTPAATTIPQYRLFSPVTKEHLYTTDANEYAILPTRGWSAEGVAYTMFKDAGTYAGQFPIPLYRMYHPGIFQHHWTTDQNEVATLVAIGAWQYEGIAGYLLPSPATGSTPLYRLAYSRPPLHLWTIDANEKNVLTTQYAWGFEGIVGEVLP